MFKKNSGISLIVLVITIIIIIILATAIILNVAGNNNIISKATNSKNEYNKSIRLEELSTTAGSAKITLAMNNGVGLPALSGDIVQPWYCDKFTVSDWTNHLKILKRAGINTVVIQWTTEFKNNKIKYLGYDSELVNNPNNLDTEFNSTDYSLSKNMLGNLLEASQNNNMKVFVGLSLSTEWWSNAFTDQNWCSTNANLTNTIANEIYTKYKAKYPDAFAGWYWSWEMYTTPNKYETNWSYMMNINLDYLTTLDSSLPLMFAPFISSSENATVEQTSDQWTNFINNTHFRNGDIICLQDGLATSDYSVQQVIRYIKAIKDATSTKLKFWLDVENFEPKDSSAIPASVDRYTNQLTISALYAEKLICFSYLHYYDPLKDGIGEEYNKLYKQYISDIKIPHIIPTPEGGSVYTDPNGDEAPIPKDFEVSNTSGENTIENGLVIKDKSGNEFVWIPVDGGIKLNGDYIQTVDGNMVEYKKWCKSGNVPNNTADDILPTGISETNQISKYNGFYISRYEASFNYNDGNIRVASKASTNSTQTEDWRSNRTKQYDGYVWNFVKYLDAKKYSEEMDIKYNYDQTISTGLVTGTQWDTIMRWLNINNINIDNSITWGNYNNSEAPANTGNYENSKLKPSGSNENWKVKNIYDLAGNLCEWTSELNATNLEQAFYRSTDYNGNGIYGPASYRCISNTGDYCYPNVGFRVVLYIK